ncbi:aldehyde dehydrogenase (NADP(+)) [Mycobacterium sp. MS1601]|uniref:aldehyde dehydrogenase family protein n=1 Tax=Mycobacterium sp. MS1601 TaxID=1936029 RepID=UPI0009793593|nr:aldehyde dehydrogenase family protein [Mycobacterium sp. MS1601]AQA03086.1 aldehyde dehydrogenase (NADP(+)) [Mycobacterium sp. MS1601]
MAGTNGELDATLHAAADAAPVARRASAQIRAAWLNAVADGLDANADYLVAMAGHETRLPASRLRTELGRTAFQARLFAKRLLARQLFDVRIDTADPSWPIGPRPDLRRGHVAIGPVLVFAAGHFPFALSVAGSDTVSALAAGCPVVVKAHHGHPDLSRATARVVAEKLAEVGAPAGLFGLIEGRRDGAAAVQDRRIKAATFTGSRAGGRLLFDLAMSRPDPIPFYGQLGSTNPVLVTQAGWRERAEEIASEFVAAFTVDSGRFRTHPGVVLVPDLAEFLARLTIPEMGPLMGRGVADGFTATADAAAHHPGVELAMIGPAAKSAPGARVLATTAGQVLADPAIVTTEFFGPGSLLVGYSDQTEAYRVLELFEGTWAASVQGGAHIDAQAAEALDLLTERAGRVIWNQWPTEVSVTDAQQHGGPWPATTVSTVTSVGTAAALRFVRPIAFQNMPAAGLPAELR